MPNSEENKPVRWRETDESEPSGFNRIVHRFERVVEGPGPIPAGREAATDAPYDWRPVKE